MHPAWVQRQQTLFDSVDFVVYGWWNSKHIYFLNDLQGCTLAEEHKNSSGMPSSVFALLPTLSSLTPANFNYDSPSSILEHDCLVQITELDNQYLLGVHALQLAIASILGVNMRDIDLHIDMIRFDHLDFYSFYLCRSRLA